MPLKLFTLLDYLEPDVRIRQARLNNESLKPKSGVGLITYQLVPMIDDYHVTIEMGISTVRFKHHLPELW